MPFKKFRIPPKSPDKEHCNVRIWLEGDSEAYCENPPVKGGRCAQHSPKDHQRARKEEYDLERIKEASSVTERANEILKNRRNLTSLDEQVAKSLAVIREMEDRYPIEDMPSGVAQLLSKLRREHSELVQKRVDLEIKLQMVLDADWMFERVIDIFERRIVDDNTRKIVGNEFAALLDEAVKGGKAITRATED